MPRGGLHPQVGRLTVDELLHELVHHDGNHLRQALGNVQAYVWPHMGNARRFTPGTTRLVWSASPSMMGVIAASQASRRAVSAGIGCDHSSSAAIEPGSLLRVAMSTLTARCGFWPATAGSCPPSNNRRAISTAASARRSVALRSSSASLDPMTEFKAVLRTAPPSPSSHPSIR